MAAGTGTGGAAAGAGAGDAATAAAAAAAATTAAAAAAAAANGDGAGAGDGGAGDAGAGTPEAPTTDEITAAERRFAADKFVADKAAEAAAAAAAAAEGGSGSGGAAAAAGTAPDKYELTTPEGLEGEGHIKTHFEAMAKRRGLTNDQAQEALNTLPAEYEAQATLFEERTKAHAEIGGDHLKQTELDARLFLDVVLPADLPEGKELRDGLTLTGYGNWTPLVMAFARAGKRFREDHPGEATTHGGDGTNEKTDADTLYDGPKVSVT